MADAEINGQRFVAALQAAISQNHRVGLIIKDVDPRSLDEFVQCVQSLGVRRSIWFGTEHRPDDRLPRYPHQQARRFLGAEFELVVIDCRCGLEVDTIGIGSGLVRGGGVFILITDPQMPNSRYVQRFWDRLRHHGFLECAGPPSLLKMQVPLTSIPNEKRLSTDHQMDVVKTIQAQLRAETASPIVFTADRGRGKTSTLGFVARALITDYEYRILVVAPSRRTISPLLKHGGFSGVTGSSSFHFRVPAQLPQECPDTIDVCMVDEAAALPVDLLIQLTKRYPKIVFSTTTHGYEGSGQGFAIRFRSFLDAWSPHWTEIHMDTPIRWSSGDGVESGIRSALCLDADLPPISESNSAHSPYFEKVDRDELIGDEAGLYGVFGLLVGAHYRTVPGDLMRFLDDDRNELWVCREGEDVIGALVGSWEGKLDQALAEAMAAGQRRPHGHFIPGVLSAHLGLVKGALIQSYRIQRIAVHPERQRRGLGRQMVRTVKRYAETHGADLVGTSFGATAALLRFWQSCGLSLTRLGLQRGRSTGEFSALMTYGFTAEGTAVKDEADQKFMGTLDDLMETAWSQLEFPLVHFLARSQFAVGRMNTLTSKDHEILRRLGHDEPTDGPCQLAVRRLIWTALAQWSEFDEYCDAPRLVARFLQGRSASQIDALFWHHQRGSSEPVMDWAALAQMVVQSMETRWSGMNC